MGIRGTVLCALIGCGGGTSTPNIDASLVDTPPPGYALDSTFGTNGITPISGTNPYLVPMPDGSVWSIGTNGSSSTTICSLTSTGKPNPAFGATGCTTVAVTAYRATADGTGVLMVASQAGSIKIHRVGSNGALDTTYGGTGSINWGPISGADSAAVPVIIATPDGHHALVGKLLSTGYSGLWGQHLIDAVASPSPATNINVSVAGFGTVFADPTGFRFVAPKVLGSSSTRIVRVDVDFANPSTVDFDTKASGPAAIDGSGRILVAGSSPYAIWRIDAAGDLDNTYAPAELTAPALALVAFADGSVVVHADTLKAFTPSGTVDPTLTVPAAYSAISSLAISDGKLLVGASTSGGAALLRYVRNP